MNMNAANISWERGWSFKNANNTMVGAIGKIQGTGGMRGTLFFLGRKKKKMYHGKNWRWLIK
jgi:hypothetical protein